MVKYGLHGKLIATEGNGDQLASILLKASDLVSAAKGCRIYIISRDNQDRETIWVTELWDSKEDHDLSLKDKKIHGLIMQAMPLLNGMSQKGQELEVIGGKGFN